LGKGIVGIGLGGQEIGHPPEKFEAVYAHAKKKGFRLHAHAGEAAGPESVWGAIRTLNAERIGHGVRSVEDEELMSYLRETQIPVEVCPTSNLRTKIYSVIEEHPIRKMYDSGLNISINSDGWYD